MTEPTIAQGETWLGEVLRLMGMPAPVSGTLVSDPLPTYWLTIDHQNLSPDQVLTLIGERGQVIDALQYLANVDINRSLEQQEQHPLTLELAGYRQKRNQEIFDLATQVAERVRTSGQGVEIRDLSAAERRQVHQFFMDYADLTTTSQGVEPDRRLVVMPRIAAEPAAITEE